MCDRGIRVLELYSGIGGMHYALESCNFVDAKVVAAVDISPLANTVYRHNFNETLHLVKGIEGFSAKELDNLNFNVVMMSPPCQPFTRVGLKKDVEDPRAKSFLHLLKLFPQLKNPPKFILLENVKGFEDSKAHKLLCDVLEQLDYSWQGFLISPKHLNIPNSRLRYYFLAKRKPLTFREDFYENGKVLDFLPSLSCHSGKRLELTPSCSLILEDNEMKGSHKLNEEPCTQRLQSFLEDLGTESEYNLPEKVVSRYLPVMDIVSPGSTGCTCFTKSYGHYIEGTGSILNLGDLPADNSAEKLNKDNYKLRYFTPREIANIMGFPKDFQFPEISTRKQKYRLLGNSLNVKVVAYLLTLLIDDFQNSSDKN